MKDEITNKLSDFLYERPTFKSECEVVYVLVELRKLLDHYKADAPLLKFYADWSVHTQKDRIDSNFKGLAKKIYEDAVAEIESTHGEGAGPVARLNLAETQSPLIAFAHGDTLALELQTFLRKHQLPTDLTGDAETWFSFTSLLVKVLENQPVMKPHPGIAKMYFESSANQCVILRIDFTTPIRGFPTYRYMNVLSR